MISGSVFAEADFFLATDVLPCTLYKKIFDDLNGAAHQAIVTAEDADSPGHVLRCDVIVDEIRSLQIVTKTHDLYLEEPPEEFAVRAYDEQGNEFSTLEKIVFKWSIENIVKQKSTGDNIRFINFRDSEYALETSVMDIEASGRQGSKVLLEGIKTGK